MKKSALLILIISTLTTGTVFSQSESPASKYVMNKFHHYYNEKQPDSIFNMFSPATKTALPLEKTRGFLNQLYTNYGKIEQTSFKNYQSGFGIYKTSFKNQSLQLGLAVDQNQQITGVFARPYIEEGPSKRNLTKIQLPFKGEWAVFWGGDTEAQNYHVVSKMQKNAFDMVIQGANGKSYKTDGKSNEDYYAFGQSLTSPCDAEVVFAVDGVKDNVPGKMNTMHTLGNSVLLKTPDNEYIVFAHFKQGSVKVKAGEKIKTGQLLGLCGNSGNSSEAHLHFHLQDIEDFNQATGIKCYFDKLTVNGAPKTDYSPVKGDKIKL